MKFEGENFASLLNPSEAVLARRLKSLKRYGAHSYASLTDERGAYLQVAGGGATCLVERYDSDSGRRFRAFLDRAHPLFPDGTALEFGAGALTLKSDEWLSLPLVLELFLCFRSGVPYPDHVFWREAPGF